MVLVEGNFAPKEYQGKTYLNVLAFNVEILASRKTLPSEVSAEMDVHIDASQIPF